MSNSNAPVTLQDFKDSHANSGAYAGEAKIHYTVNGQPHSFESPTVSGGFSQTYISGGDAAAVFWRYRGALLEGPHYYGAEKLFDVVFFLGIKSHTGVVSGGMNVTLEYFNDQYGEITGTIERVKIVTADGTEIDWWGDFFYTFPEAK